MLDNSYFFMYVIYICKSAVNAVEYSFVTVKYTSFPTKFTLNCI